MTGLAITALLRASHIKPWADCETDAERLDVYNGILLAPHLDAAFDRGFITLRDDTEVSYLISIAYEPRAQRGFRWDDPALGIRWPLAPTLISARDASLPLFAARDP